MRERIRQFREATRLPGTADFAIARDHLDDSLLALFETHHPRDIVHSAGTARWLIERGHGDPDLVVAALLHDVGKGYQRRGDRVVYVISGHARVAGLLAAPESRFDVRRAVARSLAHAAASAELMLAAGASPRAAELTRLHHLPPGGDPVLALLQQADAAN